MTIKEIAQLCGVSRGTVDRVLNHRGKVKPDTEALILRTIHRMGYTKNIAGKALTVKKNAPVFGALVSSEGNPFFDDVIAGFRKAEEELVDYGVTVLLKTMRDLADKLAAEGVSADDLDRALKPTLSQIEKSKRDNKYWLGTVLAQSQADPKRVELIRGRDADLKTITADEINNAIVATKNGYVVRLSDIGKAAMGYEDVSSYVYINGEPGVYVSITKQSGSNTVSVAIASGRASVRCSAIVSASSNSAAITAMNNRSIAAMNARRKRLSGSPWTVAHNGL